ncbi:MAG: hypothetical protein ACRCX8_01540 [Sarcina sp.]
MNKEKIITYLESGISLESVVKEMASSTGDNVFIDKVNGLLKLQQFPSKEKDLHFKYDNLAEKINMLDDHLKQGLDKEYAMRLAEKYFKTLKRLEKAMLD